MTQLQCCTVDASCLAVPYVNRHIAMQSGWTALHLAACKAHPVTVDLLLQKHADLEVIAHLASCAPSLCTCMTAHGNACLACCLQPSSGDLQN